MPGRNTHRAGKVIAQTNTSKRPATSMEQSDQSYCTEEREWLERLN